MSFELKRFSRQLPALSDARLARMQLPQCLFHLGVLKIKERCGQHFKYSWNGKIFSLRNSDEWQLVDLFQAARSKWLQLVSALHPDRGGNSEICGRLNSLWQRIEFLFNRRGIDI